MHHRAGKGADLGLLASSRKELLLAMGLLGGFGFSPTTWCDGLLGTTQAGRYGGVVIIKPTGVFGGGGGEEVASRP